MTLCATPSVNFFRQSVSDATDVVRPFTLRGLSPDQTLVLVNGKRYHRTALVHIFGAGMGAGSSGVDMNTIPASAIDRIEVLRIEIFCENPCRSAPALERIHSILRTPPDALDHAPIHLTGSIRGICVGESTMRQARLAVIDTSQAISPLPKLVETHGDIGMHKVP